MDLMSLLRRDVNLALLIAAFIYRHLRNTDCKTLAFWHRDAGLVSLRRDADLELLNIASVR